MAFMEAPPYAWQDGDVKFSIEDSDITVEWEGRFKDYKLKSGRVTDEEGGRFKDSKSVKAWKVTEEGILDWPLAADGKLFSDDVYILLIRTINEKTLPPTTSYDIHCWIGKQAPEKLYEKGLNNSIALDQAVTQLTEVKPLIHRDVQDFESKRFTNYFDDFTVLKGGSDDSVNCNLHSSYKQRLLRITGPNGRNICVRETALKRGALDSNDVFIVDTGTKIYEWVGNGVSRHDKKVKRVQEYAKKLQAERGSSGIKVDIVYENEATKNHPVYDVFPNQAKKRKPSMREPANVFLGPKKKTMFTLRRNPLPQIPFEKMFRKEAEGADVCIRKMNSLEVSVVDIRFGKRDCDDHLFIRIGDEWPGDQNFGLIVGHYYLKLCPDEDKHPCIPITVVKEGQLSTQLNAAIGS